LAGVVGGGCCAPAVSCFVCVTDASSLASLMTMPNAHSDIVYSVAFSPDGTKIVSGSYDYSIKLWGVLPCTHKLHLLSVACLNGVVASVWYEQLLALACVRLWQMDQPWHLWQRCPMRTAATFTQWPSHRMAPRLCPALMTKA
jgi:WD40 repeat protein